MKNYKTSRVPLLRCMPALILALFILAPTAAPAISPHPELDTQIPLATASDVRVTTITIRGSSLYCEPLLYRVSVVNRTNHAVRLAGMTITIIDPSGVSISPRSELCKDSMPSYAVLDPGQRWDQVVAIIIGPSDMRATAVSQYWPSEQVGDYTISIALGGHEARMKGRIEALDAEHQRAMEFLRTNNITELLFHPPLQARLQPHQQSKAKSFLELFPATSYRDYVAFSLGTHLLYAIDRSIPTYEETKRTWREQHRAAFKEAAANLEPLGKHRDFPYAPDSLLVLGRWCVEFPMEDAVKAEQIATLMMQLYPKADASRCLNLDLALWYTKFREDPVAADQCLSRVVLEDGVLDDKYVLRTIEVHILRKDAEGATAVLNATRKRYPHSRFGNPVTIYWQTDRLPTTIE
ncbi:MAG: hypothetical protein HY343_11550 [Lentisphaerae bacterium]|nr:hypothetical protein [Lentisphaerota bacterium]